MTSLLFFTLLFVKPATPPLTTEFQSHIRFLADDLMEGRETSFRGQKIAARYIAGAFEREGLTPVFPKQTDPFYQHYDVEVHEIDEAGTTFTLSGNGPSTKLTYGGEFRVRIRRKAEDGEVNAQMVFVGYGVHAPEQDYDDLAGVDLKGKWAVLLAGEPEAGETAEKLSKLLESNSQSFYRRMIRLRMMGAAGIIFLMNDENMNRYGGGGNTMSLPKDVAQMEESTKSNRADFFSVSVPESKRKDLFGKDYREFLASVKRIHANGKPASFELKKRNAYLQVKLKTERRTAENVVAILPGTDPNLRDEYVVISAHYDHVGVHDGEVFNGADDNASGTAALLVLARRLKDQPIRRSLLFLAVSGEEKGLLGSEYFIANPPIPLSQLAANINVDMIGRNDAREIGIIPALDPDGVSTLTDDVIQINDDMGKPLTLLENMDSFHTRSDHYNFVQAGVPALFFFSGTHDDYHKSGDDWEKLDYGKIERVYHLFEKLTVHTLNGETRPAFKKDLEKQDKAS